MIVDRIGNENLIRKSCEVCGATFHVKKYRAKTARFCSQVCGGSWHATTRLARVPKPHMKGNKLRQGIPPSNKGMPAPKGEDSPSWKKRVQRVCEHCGEIFSRAPWVEKQNGIPRFCSQLCFAESGVFKGEKSSLWIGGPQTSRGRNWHVIRAAVVLDQDGNCGRCGIHVGPSMPVHHIKPFRLFATAAEANVRSNLIGLCQPCHMTVEAESSERTIRRIEAAQRQSDLFVQQPTSPKPVTGELFT